MDPRIPKPSELIETIDENGDTVLTASPKTIEGYIQQAAGLLAAGHFQQVEAFCNALYIAGIRNPGLRALQAMALGFMGNKDRMLDMLQEPSFQAALAESAELREIVEKSTQQMGIPADTVFKKGRDEDQSANSDT